MNKRSFTNKKCKHENKNYLLVSGLDLLEVLLLLVARRRILLVVRRRIGRTVTKMTFKYIF